MPRARLSRESEQLPWGPSSSGLGPIPSLATMVSPVDALYEKDTLLSSPDEGILCFTGVSIVTAQCLMYLLFDCHPQMGSSKGSTRRPSSPCYLPSKSLRERTPRP